MSINRNVEEPILRRVCAALIEAGFKLTVDYENGYMDEPPVQNSTDIDAIVEEAFAVDEFHLMTSRSGVGGCGNSYDSFVYFIWANGDNGWTCISDYNVSLETILQPVNDWIDEQEAA